MNEKFNPKMDKIRVFFPRSEYFFSFQKRSAESSPIPFCCVPAGVDEYASVPLNILKHPWSTSQTKICKELGLESLKFRRYFRRICTFFKIQQSGLPSYLLNLIPQSNIYNSRQWDKVESFFLMLLINGTSSNQIVEMLNHI